MHGQSRSERPQSKQHASRILWLAGVLATATGGFKMGGEEKKDEEEEVVEEEEQEKKKE